jgi:hypothetical protein
MKHGKRDLNHDSIKATFEQLGCTITDTADLGNGFPDLVVGICGVNLLVEVKSADGELSEGQAGWHERWKGQVAVVRSKEEVISLVQSAARPKREGKM